nr:MAG TPA: hypothetical protein [Caudoviricetes sp.]DAY08072.1 MAG TPA: hypothetical protein [Caudoviricetes sp.]
MPRLPGLLIDTKTPDPVTGRGSCVSPSLTGQGARLPSRSPRGARPGSSPDGSG